MSSVWLVFCDCGFHSVCPLIHKDKSLVEAPYGSSRYNTSTVTEKSRPHEARMCFLGTLLSQNLPSCPKNWGDQFLYLETTH